MAPLCERVCSAKGTWFVTNPKARNGAKSFGPAGLDAAGLSAGGVAFCRLRGGGKLPWPAEGIIFVERLYNGSKDGGKTQCAT